MRIALPALALMLAAHSWSAEADAAYKGGIITPPLPKPGFVLTDTSGAPFDFRARTQGLVTLLFFGYTYCPDQCPLHMANIGMALKKLPFGTEDRVKLVFVTTDPARDTPAVLRRWLDRFDPRFIGLTGTEAAIESVQRAAGVPVARKTGTGDNYGVAHANYVLAYTRDNLAHLIYPGGVGRDDWIHDLPHLLEETWATRGGDVALIQAIVDEEVAAWNSGDAAAYSRHFAPDGIFTNIYGMTFDGRDAFEKRHAATFAAFFKGSSRGGKIRQVKFVTAEVAIVDVDTEVRGLGKMPPGISISPDGVLRTRLQQVLFKREGQWWVVSYHNVAIAAPRRP
jgi:protein SCO1